jgi:PadR family transcriptional regulator, regulatory protein PadR
VSRKSILGEFEQTVLLAILQLGDDAYAQSMARHLDASIGRAVSRGALYSCLNQLERKGLLRWRVDAPTPVRAGHSRRFYQVSARGMRALRQARESQLMMWRGLEDLLAAK